YDQSDLYVIGTAAGSQPRNLTAAYDYDVLSGLTGDQAAPRAARGARPVWNNDSKKIIITTAEEGKVNLKRLDAAGGGIEAWTSGQHDIMSFVVRDGRAIALISTPTMIGDL